MHFLIYKYSVFFTDFGRSQIDINFLSVSVIDHSGPSRCGSSEQCTVDMRSYDWHFPCISPAVLNSVVSTYPIALDVYTLSQK